MEGLLYHYIDTTASYDDLGLSYFSILEDDSLREATVWSYHVIIQIFVFEGGPTRLFRYGRSNDPKIHSCSSFCFVLLRFPKIQNTYSIQYCTVRVCSICVYNHVILPCMVVKVVQSHISKTIDPNNFTMIFTTLFSAPSTPKLLINYPFLRNSQIPTPFLQNHFFNSHFSKNT